MAEQLSAFQQNLSIATDLLTDDNHTSFTSGDSFWTNFVFNDSGTTSLAASNGQLLDGVPGAAQNAGLHPNTQKDAAFFADLFYKSVLTVKNSPQATISNKGTGTKAMSHAYTQFGTPGPAGGPASGGWA